MSSTLNIIHSMAKMKPVAQMPRFLLPRVTWTGKSSRFSTTPLRAAAHPLKPILLVPQIQQPQQRRRSFSTITHSPSKSQGLRGGYKRPSTPASQALDLEGPPIRHDGVYVATFKPARRAFHATAVMAKDHHFDTLKFVQRLKDENFSEEQAAAMMRVLNDVIEESIQNLTRTMVLREGASIPSHIHKETTPD